MADDRLPNGLEHKYEKIPQSMYQTVISNWMKQKGILLT